jgi:hypothetical protein
MTFELELGEIRLWCSSPECTRKLVEKGARLVNPAQAEHLSRLLGGPVPVPSKRPSGEAATSH